MKALDVFYFENDHEFIEKYHKFVFHQEKVVDPKNWWPVLDLILALMLLSAIMACL